MSTETDDGKRKVGAQKLADWVKQLLEGVESHAHEYPEPLRKRWAKTDGGNKRAKGEA